MIIEPCTRSQDTTWYSFIDRGGLSDAGETYRTSFKDNPCVRGTLPHVLKLRPSLRPKKNTHKHTLTHTLNNVLLELH